MARAARVAVLGGTFDHFHAGHRDLLDAAFQAADRVGIGVTTDAYLRAHPKPLTARLESYRRRRSATVSFLEAHYPRRRWWVVALKDGWGRSVEPGVDVLVVSAETAAAGRAVNEERRRRGSPPLKIITVPLQLAEDLIPLSSRAVRAGLVDRSGKRLTALRVVVPSGPPGVPSAIRDAFREEFAPLPIRAVSSNSATVVPSPRRLPAWDYSIEWTRSPSPAHRLRLTDRSGWVFEWDVGDRVGTDAARGVHRALSARRKTFSVRRGSSGRWRRTSASRSTARGRGHRRSPTA
ncbi:MAG: pantetheine-phosphate adenylyltransferase [Thermoplasmata archaeon]|nr:pantetheine-phosphate adenylyltransferase [Thermoplasmata archaeon]